MLPSQALAQALAEIPWIKQRFPIKDFGNGETLNILIFKIYFRNGNKITCAFDVGFLFVFEAWKQANS